MKKVFKISLLVIVGMMLLNAYFPPAMPDVPSNVEPISTEIYDFSVLETPTEVFSPLMMEATGMMMQ